MKKRMRERGAGIALRALPAHLRFSAVPAVLTLASFLGGSTTWGAPLTPDRGTQLLESSPNSIRFRVRFPAPEWRTEEIATGILPYPMWPGLPSLARPGEAEIGVRIVRVAVPPQGAIRVEEVAAGGGRADGIRFPAAPGSGHDDARLLGKAIQAKPLPPVHAVILAVGVERGLRIATLAVRPARRGGVNGDPGKGGDDIQWADEVEVRLRIDGTQPARTGSPRPDPVQAPLWRETLLNPDSVRDFLTRPAVAAAFPDTWFDDAGGWLKIQIAANGVYTLSHDGLAAAGVPVGAIDPRTIRLFSGPLVPDLPWTTLGWDTLIAGTDTSVVSGWDSVSGRPGFTTGFGEAGGFEEIAIWVEGEEDGDFGASDRVIFHALGPDNFRDRFGLAPGGEEFFENPYTKHTIYWLAWGGALPGAPRRMAQVTVTPPGGTTPATETTARVHAERNAEYVPYLVQPGLRTETWFWDVLNTQSLGKRFPVNLPFAVPGNSISAHIRVWGANIPGPDTPLHQVQLDVNGVTAGLYQWGGDTPYTALTPQDMFVSGIPVAQPSNFDFRVPSLVPGRNDQSYLAWIDVTYRRSLALGGLAGELPADAGAPGRTIRISQVPAGTLDLFDVTDFRSPRRLTGFTALVTVAGPGVEMALDDPGQRMLAVATRSIPSSPAALVLDDPPAALGAATWLRDPAEPLDYMIVTHDTFLPEAEALADRRRQSLHGITPGRAGRARAVRVSDVMDEFAWGMWDPTALRYFLEYAYLYYGGSGAEPVAYCVFLGDHTYDFRQVEVGAADLVPSWEDNQGNLGDFDGSSVQYASDDPLARFDGPRDPYLDLAIGRIPVSNSADARAVVEDKILRSETQPAYGPWRSRVLLAADDLCQAGNPDPVADQTLAAAVMVDNLLPPEYDRSMIYLTEYGTTCDILFKPQAAADFQAAWNEGAWLVNYLGHGDEIYLADERLINLTDVPDLTNLDRLPLFIASASKSAKYNLPRQSSITEALAASAVGGALAATGSVSNQTYANPTFALNEEFVTLLFETDLACLCPANPRPAGLAFAAAKRGIIPEEAPKYVFFGDPASVPPAPVLTSLVLAGPDSSTRGGLAPVRARLTNPAFANGTLDLRALDASRAPALGALPYRLPGDLMFRGEAAFTADSVSAAFVVPFAAREGPDARIRGYAQGADWDAVGAVRNVVIQGQVDPSTDTAGPLITFGPHGVVVVVGQVLTAVLEDPSGIRLYSPAGAPIELVVRDPQNTEVARLSVTNGFVYDSGSYTKGQVSFPVPDLADGAYRITLTALDNFGNPAGASTDVEVETNPEARFHDVYAYPNPMEAETTDVVFTLDRSFEVSIRIFSVAGRTVRKATIQAAVGRNGWRWDGRDEAGDPVANGVYLLRLTAKATGGEDSAEHLERLVVVR